MPKALFLTDSNAQGHKQKPLTDYSKIWIQQMAVLGMLVPPQDEIVKRIILREKDSNRNDDPDGEDDPQTLSGIPQTKTAPIFSYYDGKHKAHKISGLGTIDDIFQHLCDTIDSLHV